MKTLKLFLLALITLSILTAPPLAIAYDSYLPSQDMQQAQEGDPDGVEDFTSSGSTTDQELSTGPTIQLIMQLILRAIWLG